MVLTAMIIFSIISSAGMNVYSIYKSAKLASNTSLLQLYTAALTNDAEKLATKINSNAVTRSKMVEAYSQKDVELANRIITASPFSTYYKNLVAKRNEITKAFNQNNTKLLDEEAELYQKSAKIRQTANEVNALYPRVAGGTLKDSKAALEQAKQMVNNLESGDDSTSKGGNQSQSADKQARESKIPASAKYKAAKASQDVKQAFKDPELTAKKAASNIKEKGKNVVSGLEKGRQAAENAFKAVTDFIVNPKQSIQNLIDGGTK